jgi:DNA topoisomerase IA
VIGIGRVKTPTLAIVCLRELEIRNFQPEVRIPTTSATCYDLMSATCYDLKPDGVPI